MRGLDRCAGLARCEHLHQQPPLLRPGQRFIHRQARIDRQHNDGKLTARDLHALTPLIWEHVNPYGRFELDMDSRISALR